MQQGRGRGREYARCAQDHKAEIEAYYGMIVGVYPLHQLHAKAAQGHKAGKVIGGNGDIRHLSGYCGSAANCNAGIGL